MAVTQTDVTSVTYCRRKTAMLKNRIEGFLIKTFGKKVMGVDLGIVDESYLIEGRRFCGKTYITKIEKK